MDDLDRLKKIYGTRNNSEDGYNCNTYNVLRENVLYLSQSSEAAIVKIILDRFKRNTSDLQVLEIGTAWGFRLRGFLNMGFKPENLYGVDILDYFIEEAKELSSPKMNFRVEDAQHLSFHEERFDVILQCTAFSSITSYEIKQNIAKEMKRLLKPNGIIIWIDSSVPGQSKRHNGCVYYKSIPIDEIKKLFSGCKIKFYDKIYLKPFFLELSVKLRVGYLLQMFSKERDDVLYYGINKKLLSLFNSISLCKSHTVAAIVKNHEKDGDTE